MRALIRSSIAILTSIMMVTGIGAKEWSNDLLQLRAEPRDAGYIRVVVSHEGIPTTTTHAPTVIYDPALIEETAGTANSVRSSAIEVIVDPETLCLNLVKNEQQTHLTEICPQIDEKGLVLNVTKDSAKHVYGLGQYFAKYGGSNGDWVKHGRRSPSFNLGNAQDPLGTHRGRAGNTQIPVVYVVGENGTHYGMFFDVPHPITWNFRDNKIWEIKSPHALQFYIFTAPDIISLRQQYMRLTGHPPVPPRKMFGLWVSEYSYDNWEEVWTTLNNLKLKKFPVDGFVLDLEWFGGIQRSEKTQMGAFNWDAENFPDAKKALSEFSENNISFMTIEEPYVGKALDIHAKMENKRLLVAQAESQQCVDEPYVPVELNSWWGKGGMIDWTNESASAWLHDEYRLPNIIRHGITAHWLDLGEPEDFKVNGCYAGYGVEKKAMMHPLVHNYYDFFRAKSVWHGYQRHNKTINSRPFILLRSGAPGIQRFGAALWSGDVDGNLRSLTSHFNAQMHLMLSGIDYYGIDVGGFYRAGDDEDTYTQWYANSSWFDIPLRPHTFNIYEEYETSPAEIGDLNSNLFNIRNRYKLIPYYYSLAYQAHLHATPIVAPAFVHFPNDSALAAVGHHKMIGPYILVRGFAYKKKKARTAYLPEGTWYEYHSSNKIVSMGEDVGIDPTTIIDGLFTLPAFVRAGAIIPELAVPAATIDAFGNSVSKQAAPYTPVTIYPGSDGAFQHFEDDGTTLAFSEAGDPLYSFQATQLEQSADAENNSLLIDIHEATVAGGYPQTNRDYLFTVIMGSDEIASVNGNSGTMQNLASLNELHSPTARGWTVDGAKLYIRTGNIKSTERLTLRVKF